MADRPWEKDGWVTMADEHHEIRGVTPEMLDWWWDNMEKGYPLWHPVDHHDFVWEQGKSPGEIGHIGAVQIADQGVQRTGGARATWLNVDVVPFTPEYDHVLVLEGFSADEENMDIDVHQYEARDYGSAHRWTILLKGPKAEELRKRREAGNAPPRPKTWNNMTHFEAEAYCWQKFLPDLYRLWSVVEDPLVNPHCNLKVKKMPNGKIAYIYENKPPMTKKW